MIEPFEVTCPCCKSILFINRTSGKIMEVREPLPEDTTGDKITDAFKKAKKQKAILEEKFKGFKEKEEQKKKSLDELFKKTVKKAKDSGEIEKPESPFEFD